MQTLHHFFLSSNETVVLNDQIVSGSPFQLEGFSYVITIRPQSNYWRFGMRLSRKENIEFFNHGSRYPKPGFEKYIDLHIGVGNWDNTAWSAPNQIELKQYNVSNEYGDIDFKSESYVSKTPVTWVVTFDAFTNIVTTKLNVEGQDLVQRTFPVDREFSYFKFFAWADATAFNMSVDIEVIQSADVIEQKPIAIKTGNLVLYQSNFSELLNEEHFDSVMLPINESNNTQYQQSMELVERLRPGFQMIGRNLVNEMRYGAEENPTLLLTGSILQNGGLNDSHFKILLKNFRIRLESFSKQQFIKAVIPVQSQTNPGFSITVFLKALDEIFNTGIERFIVHVVVPDENAMTASREYFLGRYFDASHSEKCDAMFKVEKHLQTKLKFEHYKFNEIYDIVFLALKEYEDPHFDIVKLTPNLTALKIFNSQILDFYALKKFRFLKALAIEFTYVPDLDFLRALPKLDILELEETGLKSISGIESQSNLKMLSLQGNQIRSIAELSYLSCLKELYLNRNHIVDISPIFRNIELKKFDISYNPITSILGISSLRNLEYLSIARTQIEDGTELATLRKLDSIYLNEIPWLQTAGIIISDQRDDQIVSINNYFERNNSIDKKPFVAPVKVLFLGNHGSGKSSLVEYLQTGNVPLKMDSTHIIRVEKYPRTTTLVPTAVFFDFGGQDYYHGIYRAFLTGRAIYLMIWNDKTNKNKKRPDTNGHTTQDYNVVYWMAHRTYLVNEKFQNPECPTFLIQTYFDDSGRKDPQLSRNTDFQIKNEFALSLHPEKSKTSEVYKSGLTYLHESLKQTINDFAKKDDQPQWYINFINFILQQINGRDHLPMSINEIESNYGRQGISVRRFLIDDLQQLHDQGLILYYPNIADDVAWLNPTALVKYIHDNILTKELVKKGHIDKKSIEGFDKRIIQLLTAQKVIFENKKSDSSHFIVPNFLPLSSDNPDEFDLMTFGLDEVTFSLKFYEFMPFGLINQLICFFGTKGDLKLYWRDQLLFTLQQQTKVLIKIDLDQLEIKIYTHHHKEIDTHRRKNIFAYLFYTIVGTYWDFELFEFDEFLSFRSGDMEKRRKSLDSITESKFLGAESIYQKEACWPSDLYVSLDDTNFVHYCSLASQTHKPIIGVSKLDGSRKVTAEIEPVSIFNFQPFLNTKLVRPRKCVISYSKQDFAHILEFKKHLDPIHKAGYIESPWNCTELYTGITWDDEIQRRFDEADIIFYMISGDLMTTQYVIDHEIKKGIDRYNSNPRSVKLIPIVLSYFDWMKPDDPYNLGRFTGLPYTLRPVDTFEDKDMIWYTISKAVRRMIEQDLDPLTDSIKWGKEIETIFREIIESKRKTVLLPDEQSSKNN
jgi:hypothetical protein